MENCEVDQMSTLREVYFEGGTMDGEFIKGIMRGGVVGTHGTLANEVSIATEQDNYFGSFNDENGDEKNGGKKVIKKLTTKGKI